MKRVICLILVLCLCLMLVGCSKTGTCEVCGKEGTVSEVEVAGETGWVCADCEDSLDALGDLANMFG